MEPQPRRTWFPILYGVLFLITAALTTVMLVTDKNLQTDFGTVSSGYFVHWYGVLVTAVADVIAAGLLFLLRSRTAVKLGVIGSGVLALVFVGIIFTYSQVGFSSAGDFAQYLFGVTYFGGDIRYLYDLLLGTYVFTFVCGAVGLVATRNSPEIPDAATRDRPSSS
jgi:hypothetical protein